MKKLFAVALVAASLVGCASVPMGDAKQDAALKTYTVAPDKAGIYIYRNETMGAAIKMDVAVDGAPIGQTAANTYLYKEVTPGKHTVVSQGADKLDVDAAPGTLTFIWQEVKMGMMAAGSKLHLVDATQGKKGVNETQLAVTK
jgi:hypothetical protein